ncbi:hypothetical protein FJR48_10555 [Sulfurimonas lithotrophica]|uniref:Right handed beta helix domain-containing protein n=1 Tax=Sulfurimonas lithotrophica TaxID=2590022 RepID=A0A5P8P336_9BACT|nr:hypothetical protein [Sulfurimonas lithotrophica]QFR50142.1 hypothetical protein FJR48_10555 [Sulfurimonas lithotrophica]
MNIKKKILLSSVAALAALSFTACGGSDSSTPIIATPSTPVVTSTLSGDITSDMTLTSDKVWVLDGLVVVKNGATLTVEPGTTVAGLDGTGSATSYLVIDKGSKIMAEGTQAEPIIFTSTKVAVDGEAAAVGQWGGVTIIGNAGNAQVEPYEVDPTFVAGDTDLADNSGVLKYVEILNSGITMAQDKEINGLSLVGVGSGTTIENITVDNSDDDGIELWGGTVNLTNITITRCTDDHFDIDDGYAGTVTNLNITQTSGNAAIEMSGTTHATFDGFTIVQNTSAKEGGIYFKKDGIGGHFKNGVIIDNVADSFGAIHSLSADEASDTADIANTSFENVTVGGTSTGARFTGTSDAALETKFKAGNTNTIAQAPTVSSTLSGDITSNKTLTADTLWIIDGLVTVNNNATLTIEPGTTIAGLDGNGAATSYLVIDKGSKIEAPGTAANPITFTSTKVAVEGEAPAVGQWGGVTIIGNAGNAQVEPYEVNPIFVAGDTDLTDNSGTLTYIRILNSGITMEQDKEINGLSFVGVGSGTTVDNITIDNSDDDGIELWGGTVDLSNIYITRCTDDHFDIDDGYAGTVTNLNITQTSGNAAIEMSGTTHATFDGFTIVQNASAKEGGIYFKKDNIGGFFSNGTITDNVDDAYGAIHSLSADEASDTVDGGNITFTNVTINGTSTDDGITGTSDATLSGIFDGGAGNAR